MWIQPTHTPDPLRGYYWCAQPANIYRTVCCFLPAIKIIVALTVDSTVYIGIAMVYQH